MNELTITADGNSAPIRVQGNLLIHASGTFGSAKITFEIELFDGKWATIPETELEAPSVHWTARLPVCQIRAVTTDATESTEVTLQLIRI